MSLISQIILGVYLIIGLRRAQINIENCSRFGITVSYSFTLGLVLFWALDLVQFTLKRIKGEPENIDTRSLDEQYEDLKKEVFEDAKNLDKDNKEDNKDA